MLTYLYTKQYSHKASILQKASRTSHPATSNVRAYALGDKYSIKGLPELTIANLNRRILRPCSRDLLDGMAEIYNVTPRPSPYTPDHRPGVAGQQY